MILPNTWCSSNNRWAIVYENEFIRSIWVNIIKLKLSTWFILKPAYSCHWYAHAKMCYVANKFSDSIILESNSLTI